VVVGFTSDIEFGWFLLVSGPFESDTDSTAPRRSPCDEIGRARQGDNVAVNELAYGAADRVIGPSRRLEKKRCFFPGTPRERSRCQYIRIGNKYGPNRVFTYIQGWPEHTIQERIHV
jgi:hypothetical protein